jgi:hypothetical protein
MALLDVVNSVSLRVGLGKQEAALSSTDTNVQQIVSFANEAGQELGHRYGFQELTKEATFSTVNTESQGSLGALTGPDFGWVLNETMWDRTTRRPVYGPKYSAEWQQLKAQLMQGPWWQYRIRGNQVLFIPPPPVGDAIFFEWVSRYWVATSAAPTVGAQTAYATDTDVSLLSERVIGLDTLWRYKASKGLAYSEDFDKAEAAIADMMVRNASKPKLNLAGAQTDIYPGIIVGSGNWMIP